MHIEYLPFKSIVAKTKSPEWFGADYNMNIYRGCSHGCIYCDSRSECYRVEDFDTVKVKSDALAIIRSELGRKRRKGVIATGAMSDPYNPVERELRLTRGALELADRFRFGIAIATKSDLVARDADMLLRVQSHSPVLVKITITTHDNELSKKLEPGAPGPTRRFEALRELAAQGIFAGVLLMPVLPFVTDSLGNLLEIAGMAAENGAKFVYPWFGMTLRDNQCDHYYRELDRIQPGLASRYAKRYANRYDCPVPDADRLRRLFKAECKRLGLLCEMRDIIEAYRGGYGSKQLELF